MVEDFDPTTIEDEGLRQVFISLMNLVEHLSAKVAEQAEEIQRLRDENNRGSSVLVETDHHAGIGSPKPEICDGKQCKGGS